MRNRPPITIGPDESVFEAIRKLNTFDRGALPVINKKEELAGIITERDVVRKCFTSDDKFINAKISEVMTTEVAVGTPDDDLYYAVSVMKQKRIRHLPIIEYPRVVGMVSMRDLLDTELSEVQSEIKYIGMHPRKAVRPLT
jgi:CBS domain-containing protein